jgi:uncharacterized membrane-anchored protein YitT (DUF2179 family)
MIASYFVYLGIGLLILLTAAGLFAGAGAGAAWTAARAGYQLGKVALFVAALVAVVALLSR